MIKTSLTILFFIFFAFQQSEAQTTLDEIISDITLPHEGFPHGVPGGYDWSQKPRVGAQQPPEGWTAAIAWGQLYEWIGGNPSPNTRVQIKDMEMYYLSKKDNRWHLLQKSVGVDGNAYVEDFVNDVNKPADKRIESDGSVSVKVGGGYNFHFWSKLGRVKYPANDVAGCYVTVKARLVIDKADLPDDRDSAKYVMSVGGDWWQSLTAVWDQFKTNKDMGIGRFRFVGKEWKSYNMITVPVDSIRKNPPPFVALSTTDVFFPETDQGELQLDQNFPNPFPLKTSVRFTLAKTNPVNLSVIDMNGITVNQLLDKTLAAGSYSVEWDGSNLPSGNYLIKLSNNDECILKKCIITK